MNPTSDVVARLSGAIKRYGTLTALDGVDLVLHRGELLAVLGPNGAGKSTSISLLLGLIRPDGGRAELFGLDPQQIDARRRIGVMLRGRPDHIEKIFGLDRPQFSLLDPAADDASARLHPLGERGLQERFQQSVAATASAAGCATRSDLGDRGGA